MNQRASNRSVAETVFSVLALICSVPVVLASVWLLIIGSPESDEEAALSFLVGFLGSIAAILLAIPALGFGIAGVLFGKDRYAMCMGCLVHFAPADGDSGT